MKATRALLAQDGLTLADCRRELRDQRLAAQRSGAAYVPKPIFTAVFLRGIREYLRPSFHPSDNDHRRIVEETLARLAAEGVIDGMPVGAA